MGTERCKSSRRPDQKGASRLNLGHSRQATNQLEQSLDYAAALAQGQEGIVAKHRATTYRPRRRTPAGRKFKSPERGPSLRQDLD
jgi:ATP-dependent DNA ligase